MAAEKKDKLDKEALSIDLKEKLSIAISERNALHEELTEKFTVNKEFFVSKYSTEAFFEGTLQIGVSELYPGYSYITSPAGEISLKSGQSVRWDEEYASCKLTVTEVQYEEKQVGLHLICNTPNSD